MTVYAESVWKTAALAQHCFLALEGRSEQGVAATAWQAILATVRKSLQVSQRSIDCARLSRNLNMATSDTAARIVAAARFLKNAANQDPHSVTVGSVLHLRLTTLQLLRM